MPAHGAGGVSSVTPISESNAKLLGANRKTRICCCSAGGKQRGDGGEYYMNKAQPRAKNCLLMWGPWELVEGGGSQLKHCFMLLSADLNGWLHLAASRPLMVYIFY